MATNVLTALGAGSGMDVQNLVSQLADAERAPMQELLDNRQTAVEARISAQGSFRAALDALTGALHSRVSSGALSGIASVSDPTIIGMTVEPGTIVTRQSIEVKQLARAQTLSSAPVADAAAAIGSGTLTIRFGAVAGTDTATGFTPAGLDDLVVTIAPGKDNLSGIRDAINATAVDSGMPVRATIVSDADGHRLMLRGATGAQSGFVIETAGDAALEQFAFNADTAGGMERNQTALDAEIALDGLTLKRDSNNIKDLIPGATLTLGKAAPGMAVLVSADRSPVELAETVRDLAGALTELVSIGRQLSASATDTASAGALASDSHTRRALASLAQLGSAQLLDADGDKPTRLAEIGLKIDRTGSYSIDEKQLLKAVADHPAQVEKLIGALAQKASWADKGGPLAQITSTFALAVDGANGQKTALQREQQSITEARVRLDARIERYRTTMTVQFSALDRSVGQYRAMQGFLQQQIDMWTKAGKS
ncbi:MAG: flagellar filament capping protein FliD [Sphingomonadaceae bacterium]